MKKALAVILVALMIIQVTAFADINVEIKNSANDELKIHGAAHDGEKVVLFVMDIPDTADCIVNSSAGELIYNNNDKILYASSVEASGGQYVFEFSLNGVSGGDSYKAIVTAGNGQRKAGEFSFYPVGIKQSFISSIATGDITAADMTDAVSYFTLGDYAPAKNANLSSLAVILKNLRDEINGFPKIGNDYNTDEFLKILKKAFVLSSLNNGNELLFGSDNFFLYADDMEISALTEYLDYTSSLDSNGICSVKSALLQANIVDNEDFVNRFKALIHLNVLTNYKELGNAHVPAYFTKYEAAYLDSNLNPSFNLNGLAGCKWLTTVYGIVAASAATSLSALASEFNTALITDPNSGVIINPSGGVTSPGNSSGGGGLGYVQPESPVVSASSFSDVAVDFWGYEYIDILVKKGILNGKGNGIFAPDDNVKRGEYAKMITLAANLTPDGSKCTFADSKASWSAPYIGAAADAGFISGINADEFAPENDITREQAAVIIARALKLETKEPEDIFDDDALISDWARGYVYALRDLGIIEGRANNIFCPAETLTRAEAAKLIAAVLEMLS